MQKTIFVRGACEHNLKNIDVAIPRDELVVITGLSGSGKSSLAFDTIYAEGQRRYVESLSAYARQFLEVMEKPDVEHIDGLSPAISIEQKTTSRNPRSTVGTVTEISDYIRLLWARVGIPYSPETGLPIESQTVSQMVDRIMSMPESTRLNLLAPVVRGRKGEYRKELDEFKRKGFRRVRIDGSMTTVDDAPKLDKNYKHNIELVVDRIVLRDGIETRLADSIEMALTMSDGLLIAQEADTQDETLFSSRFACPVSGFTIEEIEPRLFSFNNPFGACPACTGLGYRPEFDLARIIPDEGRTIAGGALSRMGEAIHRHGDSIHRYRYEIVLTVCQTYDIPIDVPWRELPRKTRDFLLYTERNDEVLIQKFRNNTQQDAIDTSYYGPLFFEGIIPFLNRRWRETTSEKIRAGFAPLMSEALCDSCNGYRLKKEALAVRIADRHVAEVSEFTIDEARRWFDAVEAKLTPKQIEIGSIILKEIRERLHFLDRVGLGYLSLSRSSGTLSGGESQRIRLASQIGSGLTGVLYVLDEPSIGLHQRDNRRLLDTLENLRDLGNTVIVVEHDEEAIRSADQVIDMGPGAGEKGGHVVAQGKPEEIMRNPASLTGQYLTGLRQIPLPARRRLPERHLRLAGAELHNLKGIDVDFPIGLLTCVTGVSGSGKSSLVLGSLFPTLQDRFRVPAYPAPKKHGFPAGTHGLNKIIDINQSPIGRTPRSNPATYTGAFSPIRDWFVNLPGARARGYKAGRFSFNLRGGRCEACKGDGLIKIEMHFLADVYVQCDVCNGRRYNRETLEVEYKGHSIADVLEMTVAEALELFKAVPAISSKLSMLDRVGLGYIRVGQPATTLSGGEAQRVKLAKELSKRATGNTIYILDEPTTGLHFEDVKKLLEVLHALVDAGNTVVVIEHNLEVIKTADWIIDLGPEGGDNGGRVIAEGSPEDVARIPHSYTGEFLAPVLGIGRSRVSAA